MDFQSNEPHYISRKKRKQEWMDVKTKGDEASEDSKHPMREEQKSASRAINVLVPRTNNKRLMLCVFAS